MWWHPRLIVLALFALYLFPAHVRAACSLRRFDLPITMNGLRPLLHAQINGEDATFLADSGDFYGTLAPAAAAHYKLPLQRVPYDIYLTGIGGSVETHMTTIKQFTLAGVQIANVQFLVGGNDFGSGAAGTIGQMLFSRHDVEYDLANGLIRLINPQDCRNATLAYWAQPGQWHVVDIEDVRAAAMHTALFAFVNGVRLRVILDTGAPLSLLRLDAAKRAGIRPDSPGVVDAGYGGGIGPHPIRTWVAPIDDFKIGDEEVLHTRLTIGDFSAGDTEMLLGDDFLLSHRVLVANSQRRLYLTYNGGPVFKLPTPASAAAVDAASAPAPAEPLPLPAAASNPADAFADTPTSAAEFARRGAAFTARREYVQAISDLDRACQMMPSEASYFYQRGIAHWGNREMEPALADFDQALKLSPNDLQTLIARADLRARRGEYAAAIVDLDAADHAAAKEADVRLYLGDLYLRADRYGPAVEQFSDWIDVHGQRDVQMASALNKRCWARALWNQDLAQALGDCNAALKLQPDEPTILDSRALVFLRQGQYDRAVADYDRALRDHPRIAWTYYCRGVAKLRSGHAAEGTADIQAATAIDARVAEEAQQRGVAP
jgi:tetratricopeptide (TPR) repeat protein/predicted aspartyl protease